MTENVINLFGKETYEQRFNWSGGAFIIINSGDRPLTVEQSVYMLEKVKHDLIKAMDKEL